jgi:hypothetical protein
VVAHLHSKVNTFTNPVDDDISSDYVSEEAVKSAREQSEKALTELCQKYKHVEV